MSVIVKHRTDMDVVSRAGGPEAAAADVAGASDGDARADAWADASRRPPARAMPGGFAGSARTSARSCAARASPSARPSPARRLRRAAGHRVDAPQEDFREALAATLAKSQEDRRVFELVFDRFFFRAAEASALREDVREQGEGLRGGEAEELELEALRRQIAAAMQDGDEGAMRDLARLSIAAFGAAGQGSGVIGVDVQRIRRALGLRAEPQPELPPEDPRRDGVPRDALRRFEALLRRELERAQIERNRRPAAVAAARRARPRAAVRTARGPRRGAPRGGPAAPPPGHPGRCRPAATAATRTSTCAARCARRCRPAACRWCSSSARSARGARRSTSSATSRRASPRRRCSSCRCCTRCTTRSARCARSCSSSASPR